MIRKHIFDKQNNKLPKLLYLYIKSLLLRFIIQIKMLIIFKYFHNFKGIKKIFNNKKL